MTQPTTDGVSLTMRRSLLLLVVVATLAGCSSGSGKSADGSGSDAAKFCAAVQKLESAKDSSDVAAAGAAFSSAAADLHAFAPAEIKTATDTYAAMIDDLGKVAKSGSMDKLTLQKELTKGMAAKSDDIAKVAIWVSKNCPQN
jgi:uncharacterized protein YceK